MSEAGPSGIERFDTGVDLAGLMGVLSQHLYSTPDVALRELVQNAHDSLTRRALVDPKSPEPRIDVSTDSETSVLVISDNGCGLTEDEVHRYLATVGVGVTRELREQQLSDDLIGMFGLGFLSAFVVAARGRHDGHAASQAGLRRLCGRNESPWHP